MKFEIGDKVRAFGVDGIIERTNAIGIGNVKVEFINGLNRWFCADGKSEAWHKEPSLFLVEKAKKEVQWYSVAAWRKTERHPFIPVHLFASEEEFLSLFSTSKEDYHWVKLIPVCKTHGSSLVEEE